MNKIIIWLVLSVLISNWVSALEERWWREGTTTSTSTTTETRAQETQSIIQAWVWSVDEDNDWLTLDQENEHGTNPLLPDSDHDWLLDWQEIEIGTNPNIPDSDLDWINDGVEVTNGTNPIVSDNPNWNVNPTGVGIPGASTLDPQGNVIPAGSTLDPQGNVIPAGSTDPQDGTVNDVNRPGGCESWLEDWCGGIADTVSTVPWWWDPWTIDSCNWRTDWNYDGDTWDDAIDTWDYDFYNWWNLNGLEDLDGDGTRNFDDNDIDGDGVDNCLDTWPYSVANWFLLDGPSWDFDRDGADNNLDACPFDQNNACHPGNRTNTDWDIYPDAVDPCQDDQENTCNPAYMHVARNCTVWIETYEELLIRSMVYSYSYLYLDSNDNKIDDYISENKIEFKNLDAIKNLLSYLDYDREIWPENLSTASANSAILNNPPPADIGIKYVSNNDIDFLLHSMYYLKVAPEGNAQKFVLDALRTMTATMDLAKLLNPWRDWANIANWIFPPVYPRSVEKQNTLKKSLQNLIYKPYVEWLESERLSILESSIIPACEQKDKVEYYDLLLLENRTSEEEQAIDDWDDFVYTYWIRCNQTASFKNNLFKIWKYSARIHILNDLVLSPSSTAETTMINYNIILAPIEEDMRSILYPVSENDSTQNIESALASRICSNEEECIDNLIYVITRNYLPAQINNIVLTHWVNSSLMVNPTNAEKIINNMQLKYEQYARLDAFYKKFWSEKALPWINSGDSSKESRLPNWFIKEALVDAFACDQNGFQFPGLDINIDNIRDLAEVWINSVTETQIINLVSGTLSSTPINDGGIDWLFNSQGSNISFKIAIEPVEITASVWQEGWGWKCPFVYVKSDTWEYIFNSFITIDRFYRFLKWDSYTRLIPEVNNDKISISIAELFPETLYLDKASIVQVKHEPNADIQIDNDWDIYSLINAKRINFNNLDKWKNSIINLWKFNSEKIIKLKWNTKTNNSLKSTLLLKYWFSFMITYTSWNPPVIKIINHIFNDTFIWKLIANHIILPYTTVEFQYKDWGKWRKIDRVAAQLNQSNIVKIGAENLNKEIRIKYNDKYVNIISLWNSDFESDLEILEIPSLENISSINTIDDKYQLINHWEKLDLSFQLNNFDKKTSSLWLKVNWYHNFPAIR